MYCLCVVECMSSVDRLGFCCCQLLEKASYNLQCFEVVEAIGCLKGWECWDPNWWGPFKPSTILLSMLRKMIFF